jgi:hypothetical protein
MGRETIPDLFNGNKGENPVKKILVSAYGEKKVGSFF